MPRKKKKYEKYMTLGIGPDGKRIRRFVSADSEAEFDRLKHEAMKEFEVIRNPSAVTFGEYAKKWKEVYKANTSIQTRNMYGYAIAKCESIKHKPLKDVTTSDLQGIVNKHADHPRSCQQLKMTLKQIYKAAIRDGIIPPFNLAAELEIPEYRCEERRFISDAEMEKIKQIKFESPMDGLYVTILRLTGMRPAEVLALQWTDIDFGTHRIAVQRSFEFDGSVPMVKSTKTGRKRSVPLSEELSARLKKEKKKSIWIIHRNGQPLTQGMFDKMRIRILKKINLALGGTDQLDVLNGLVLYSFRHTYATWIYYTHVQTGHISTKMAAAIMGHSEEIFLKRYTHISEEHEMWDYLTKGQVVQEGDQKETKQA